MLRKNWHLMVVLFLQLPVTVSHAFKLIWNFFQTFTDFYSFETNSQIALWNVPWKSSTENLVCYLSCSNIEKSHMSCHTSTSSLNYKSLSRNSELKLNWLLYFDQILQILYIIFFFKSFILIFYFKCCCQHVTERTELHFTCFIFYFLKIKLYKFIGDFMWLFL